MKISLIDNGLDSIKKGYSHLKDYESFISSESSDNPIRFSTLKDAILSLQHGIEILFKCVLLNTNEILLFSEINEKIRSAYKQRRAGEITSLFEAKGVHTVTHKEAMLRSSDICGHVIDEKFRSQLEKLEKWRNSITHSAVFLNENEVSAVM